MSKVISKQSNANILWFLPTHGDGRYLGTGIGGREVNFNYLRQVAQAADQQQVADAFFALNLIPKAIKISDVARRPGT